MKREASLDSSRGRCLLFLLSHVPQSMKVAAGGGGRGPPFLSTPTFFFLFIPPPPPPPPPFDSASLEDRVTRSPSHPSLRPSLPPACEVRKKEDPREGGPLFETEVGSLPPSLSWAIFAESLSARKGRGGVGGVTAV